MEKSREFMEKFKALFLSLFCVSFPLTVASVSVSLYPSESIVAPFGSTVFINCSFTGSENTLLFWNFSGTLDRVSPGPEGITFETGTELVGVSKLTVILHSGIAGLRIQCQLCNTSSTPCNTDSPAQNFIAVTGPVQVFAFGPPLPLSHAHELGAVKLSWSPPLAEAVSLFTYNIIIMESTNNSLIVANINITNNAYVIVSPANITGYTNVCTSYQWEVRVAANISYGFTNVAMANDTFTFSSAPNITDAMVTGNISSIIFELIFSTPAQDAYYTLHQRDYCGNQLNSTEINNTLINITTDTMVSINIQSLIHNETWSVSVEVSLCEYNDTTQYINITNPDNIQDCNPVISSSVSQVSSSNYIYSIVTVSTPISSSLSSPTPSVTSSGGSGSWVGIGVVGGLGAALLCIAIVTYAICKVKNKRKSYDVKNDVNKVKDLNVNDTSNVVLESPRITVDSSRVEPTDIVNEGYNNVETSFQTQLSPGNSGPKSPTDEQEHHSNTNNNTYDQLDALQSSNTYEQPDIALRLGSITSPDPMYQEPGTLMLPPSTPGGRSRSKSPSHLNSLYSEPLDSAQATPIRSRCSVTPQRFDSQPVMDSGLVDMPGYTEIPANTRKSTISKRKSEIRSPNVPLPPTPVEQEGKHQYADMEEIRKNKVMAPPIVINDVLYAEVTGVS